MKPRPRHDSSAVTPQRYDPQKKTLDSIKIKNVMVQKTPLRKKKKRQAQMRRKYLQTTELTKGCVQSVKRELVIIRQTTQLETSGEGQNI